ncbi:ABC transporter permease [Streptomyces sp. NBC_01104]|uniref:ABC transporter permease n=1 Tax=Streptomyces sp. NBC_01104 TaxID=2903750 RepID=UPI003868A7AE|nr:ABC transporter permease [Streptomyces sp. NBC_01104]
MTTTPPQVLAAPGAPTVRTTSPRPVRGPRAYGRPLSQLGFAVATLLAWELAVREGLLPQSSVPTASATASALRTVAGSGDFWHALGQTALGWCVGLLLCTAIGVPAGLLIGTSRFLTRSTRLLTDFLRTIPAVALCPVLLLTLGSTMTMKLVLVVSGALWPLLTATIDGVRHVDPVAADTFRTFRLPAHQRVRRLVLPSALPFLVTGVRNCAVLALMLTTAGEYLGAAPGIGNELSRAQQAGAIDRMFALLVVAGLLGVALNSLLLTAERLALPWAPARRKGTRG